MGWKQIGYVINGSTSQVVKKTSLNLGRSVLIFLPFICAQSLYSSKSHRGQLRLYIGGLRGLSNCFITEMCSWHFWFYLQTGPPVTLLNETILYNILRPINSWVIKWCWGYGLYIFHRALTSGINGTDVISRDAHHTTWRRTYNKSRSYIIPLTYCK